MWMWYRWQVGTAAAIVGSATGALVTDHQAVAVVLYSISAGVFVVAQGIPAYAIFGRWRTRKIPHSEAILAFVPNLERVAGMAHTVAIQYENDAFPHRLEGDYITKYRPLFEDAYLNAVAFGRRFAEKELEVAISVSIGAEGLRDTSAKFMALARRTQA